MAISPDAIELNYRKQFIHKDSCFHVISDIKGLFQSSFPDLDAVKDVYIATDIHTGTYTLPENRITHELIVFVQNVKRSLRDEAVKRNLTGRFRGMGSVFYHATIFCYITITGNIITLDHRYEVYNAHEDEDAHHQYARMSYEPYENLDFVKIGWNVLPDTNDLASQVYVEIAKSFEKDGVFNQNILFNEIQKSILHRISFDEEEMARKSDILSTLRANTLPLIG